MTANKHTPGPWHQEVTNSAHTSYVVVSADGFANGSTVVIGQCAGPDRLENARLIAAAPELLEALTKKVQDAEQRMFEDWLEFNWPSGDHDAVQRQWLESNDYRGFIGEWREQLDAIAKATGGAQ